MKRTKKFGKKVMAVSLATSVLLGLLPSGGSVQAASINSVSICQAGYSVNDAKTAVVIVSGGSLSDTSYEVIRANDGSKVSSGTMTSGSPSGWNRNESYYKVDFSSIDQPGEYKIKTNGTTSNAFTISDNVWTNYTDEMIGFYRIQRCGQDTNQAMSGFNSRPSEGALHAACHTDDAKNPNGQKIDMTGGWHDAGDNNKYGGNTSWVCGALAISYLRHPNAKFDNDKNGIPDLLDEARYGAESMVKILDATGNTGVYDVIDAPNGQHYWWNYPTSESGRIAHTRDASKPLTFDATMKTAGGLAAVARAFETVDKSFSAKCKTAAVSAYSWANSNTGNTGGWYSVKNQNNIKFWAAVELYKLTKDSSYKTFAESYINGLSSVSTSTNYWGLEPISLAEYYNEASDTTQSKILSLLKSNSNSWKSEFSNPFAVSGLNSKCDFGINEPNIANAADTFRLYELTGDEEYRDAAVKALQWTIGVNPWSISWVQGIGTKYPVHPHSRLDADGNSNPGSTMVLPGFMICGPIWGDPKGGGSGNPWYQDRSLADDGDNQWRHNEYSISIQYGLVDLIVALSYEEVGQASPTPTPTPTNKPTPTPTNRPLGYEVSGYIKPDFAVSTGDEGDLNAGFKVQIVGTNLSAETDENGYFAIDGVEQSDDPYVVRISKTSYLTREVGENYVYGDKAISKKSNPIVLWAGDVNKDDSINMADVVAMAGSFNATESTSLYKVAYDLNLDGAINMGDILILARGFNKTVADYPEI